MVKHSIVFLFLLILSTSLRAQRTPQTITGARQKISLAGTWQFSLDTGNVGISQQWFSRELPDQIQLPGTTDSNRKGWLNRDSSTMHLSRIFKYEGVAWYRRKIVIPPRFKDKHVELFFERSKPSQVWVDERLIGSSSLLQTPQQFDVSSYLSPGVHYITLRVDNNLKLTPFGNVHIYSDDTQTNWNGVIGDMFVEASSKLFISDLQVYPDVDARKAAINIAVEGADNPGIVGIEVHVEKNTAGKIQKLPSTRIKRQGGSLLEITYSFDDKVSLWDEYQQPIYRLTVVLTKGSSRDTRSTTFGMRKFSVKGTQFSINNRATFLRGKHDACVFPLTGYPPTDVEGWLKVFRVAKSYGINHYRFHSWCPPEAAFLAADRIGLYLEPELSFWGGLEQDSVSRMLREEGLAMLKRYGNHPSFVMFSHGNEIWSGHDRVEENLAIFKKYDSRHLYTMGANVNIGYYFPTKSTDFFIGARTPTGGDTILNHTRLTHAFADSRNGGMLNSLSPSTMLNFQTAVSQLKMPIISHEIGQYQIYPDYREIAKYTGVLEARNLQIFKERLNAAGMLDQNRDFQKASGAWAALAYKAEMEAAIRTEGFAGFQLLDLQDFPGQGTALVGILDAFMDSKDVVTRQEWINSCNDVVLLAEFPKFCWTNKEKFSAELRVANYSSRFLKGAVRWLIKTEDGKILNSGSFSKDMKFGGLTSMGTITYSLESFTRPQKIKLELSSGIYSNSYSLWVYPQNQNIEIPGGIIVSSKLDQQLIGRIQEGASVLLFPQAADVKSKSVSGLFPPEFWNWGMFKGISENARKPVSPGTLSILTDPNHPVFKSFPTDRHTNFQWFSIIKSSRPLILNSLAKSYRPIVQVIDNLERNNKLGLVFELKVGEGKLLICMADLPGLKEKPEAVSLYQSLLDYMNSAAFKPVYKLTEEELKKLL